MSELATYRGTGKRKTSVARVILRPGDGATWFNGRTLDDYFPRLSHRIQVLAPLRRRARRHLRHPRPRARRRPVAGRPALSATASPARSSRPIPELRTVLKREGFLARDARIVERKKAGLHKARKAPQFSKR